MFPIHVLLVTQQIYAAACRLVRFI